VDVRTAEQYATYHIPGAEHAPLASLPDQVFSPTEKVVLCAEDGADATQAWFLLRARGARNAYILQGGLASWKADVLFPTLAADADPLVQQRNEQLRQVAAHFGGRAMAAGSMSSEAGTAPQAPLPKVEMPAAPSGGAPAAAAPARKKKEGC
jgi:3-mercaptopyruvate sulfurtransferase SseA